MREAQSSSSSGSQSLTIVSDDGLVTITAAEINQWQADLPHIKNLAGQVRFILRSLAHIRRPEVRRGYLCERLANAEQLAAERAEARTKTEAARDNKVEWDDATPFSPRRRKGVQWDPMMPDYDDE